MIYLQEKLLKLETLSVQNHTVIEDMYNIISLYKLKYSTKFKLPDDAHKAIKSAIKLDTDIEITMNIIVEEIEKLNLISANYKQLELACESAKGSNEKTKKYFNIRHVQVLY